LSRPASLPAGTNYFLLTFNNGGEITVEDTTLTFEQIQINMTEKDDPYTGVIHVNAGGYLILTLNKE
jgi:hypothetical protein